MKSYACRLWCLRYLGWGHVMWCLHEENRSISNQMWPFCFQWLFPHAGGCICSWFSCIWMCHLSFTASVFEREWTGVELIWIMDKKRVIWSCSRKKWNGSVFIHLQNLLHTFTPEINRPLSYGIMYLSYPLYMKVMSTIMCNIPLMVLESSNYLEQEAGLHKMKPVSGFIWASDCWFKTG